MGGETSENTSHTLFGPGSGCKDRIEEDSPFFELFKLRADPWLSPQILHEIGRPAFKNNEHDIWPARLKNTDRGVSWCIIYLADQGFCNLVIHEYIRVLTEVREVFKYADIQVEQVKHKRLANVEHIEQANCKGIEC